jgi:hypothetical protein
VARERFGVLGGYCRGNGMVMFDWPGLRNKKGYSLPRDFTKNVL